MTSKKIRNAEYQFIQVMTLDEAKEVAKIDWPHQSTQKSYIQDNALTYYLVCNTWILLWKDFAIHAYHRLATAIRSKGLIAIINECQDEALRIVKDEDLGPWARLLYSEVNANMPIVKPYLQEWQSLIGKDSDATVLCLLRYPKRFSPSSNDKIQNATLDDFLATENRTKLLQRRCAPGYNFARKAVSDVIKSLYPWDSICEEIADMDPVDDLFYLSSGAALDAKPNPGSKWKAVLEDGNLSDAILPIFGVYTLDRNKVHDEPLHYSKVVAVPKSYKSSRIIAMERVYPNARGKRIEQLFRRWDAIRGYGIDITDQTINQQLALTGSLYGTIATLDASHGSDLISKTLFKDLFPPRYVQLVQDLLPDYVEVRGKIRPLQMASTSGHTLTFRHETIIYYAIAEAALNITQDLGIPVETEVAHAFGDDTLVSTEAYEVTLYLFQRLGLMINQDKSYATGVYRESCGKDYIDGKDVSSIYYPRFPVIGTISDNGSITLSKKTFRDEYRGKLDNALTMLIDLQKKIYPYSYDCSRFIASVVQTAYPSITTSLEGEICNDLWDCIDTGKQFNPTRWRVECTRKYFSYPLATTKIGEARESLSDVSLPSFDRLCKLDTIHCYPTEKYLHPDKFSDHDVEVYEYYKYIRFLRFGPDYHDGLMELLGITSRPMSISEFFGMKTLTISRIR